MAEAKTTGQIASDIMEQAQVFASAWSLVGSWFDDGGAMEQASEAKAELRNMVASAVLAASPAVVQAPVATAYTMEALVPGGHPVSHVTLLKHLPAGTKLYTHPAPSIESGVIEALRVAADTLAYVHNNIVTDYPTGIEIDRISDSELRARTALAGVKEAL